MVCVSEDMVERSLSEKVEAPWWVLRASIHLRHANLADHGKERLRFRRKGFPSGYFKAALGTDDFRAEYRTFMDASSPTIALKPKPPGSIAYLVGRYFAVPTRLGPSRSTQHKVRRIISAFSDEYGHLPVAKVGFEHIEVIVGAKLERKMVQTPRGLRSVGGPEAARKLRKELVRLFAFATKLKMIGTNPAAEAERVKVAPADRSSGFHTWTEEEIAQFREHHQLGSRARLAMELMLWTGQRRIDAIRMGRQHIRDGRITVTQTKGGKALWIPVAPQLLKAIIAMAPSKEQLCLLVTESGKPFSNPGFGNWFRDQCDAAGLPQCTAHGLRKATMRRMAELGLAQQTLKSVSGHARDEEVAIYTRAADQKRMADDAISALARWEMSNLAEKLDAKVR